MSIELATEYKPLKDITAPPPLVSRPLGDLVRHDDHDPDELLKHRYLCRGGILLLAGPTGVGKSSFSMQCMLLWAVGRGAFGIHPAGPLKSLLIQAENDDGDLAEMRDGVLAGLNMTEEERAAALANVIVCQEDTRTGRAFFEEVVKPLLTEHKPDLLWIDPVLAFLGGDTSSQKDVGAFLRNGLNPLLHEFNVGCVCIHHTNKPPSGKEKSTWQAGDLAYLGSGSSEWANAPRAILGIRSIGSHDVFELTAGKRGSRLNWRDEADEKTYSLLIQHSKERGQICWLPASKEDLGLGGRPSGCSPDEVLGLLSRDGLTAKEWQSEALEELNVKRSAFFMHKKSLADSKKAIKSHVNGKWIKG